MMSTEEKCQFFTIQEAANQCPRPASTMSIWRWARKGLKSRSGQIIHLRHIRCGGRVLIPTGALGEFFEAVAQADAAHFDTPCQPVKAPKVNATARQREIEAARARLASEGL